MLNGIKLGYSQNGFLFYNIMKVFYNRYLYRSTDRTSVFNSFQPTDFMTVFKFQDESYNGAYWLVR